MQAQELSRGLVENRAKKLTRGETLTKPQAVLGTSNLRFHIFSLSSKKGGKKILSKFWSRKVGPANNTQGMKTSQSWDASVSSGASSHLKEPEEDEPDTIPEPPPVPTIEYLLGKRPVNLWRRANQTLKDQIKEKAAHLTTKELDSDDSSVSSSVGSSKGHQHHKKGKHRRRRGSREDVSDDGLEWSYNQLGMLQSSPASSRKEREGRRKMERKLTPVPAAQTQLQQWRIQRGSRVSMEPPFQQKTHHIFPQWLWQLKR